MLIFASIIIYRKFGLMIPQRKDKFSDVYQYFLNSLSFWNVANKIIIKI